jgi:hypothetical protein
MHEWNTSKRGKRTEDDVRAWLMIGAIFVGTLMAVWLPILFSALGHG